MKKLAEHSDLLMYPDRSLAIHSNVLPLIVLNIFFSNEVFLELDRKMFYGSSTTEVS